MSGLPENPYGLCVGVRSVRWCDLEHHGGGGQNLRRVPQGFPGIWLQSQIDRSGNGLFGVKVMNERWRRSV